MISSIRSGISKNLFKYILWGAIIAIPGGTFVMALLERGSSGAQANAVAIVNGYPISRIELQNKAREIEELMRNEWYRMLVPGALENPVEQALATLIQEKVLISTADQLGLADPSGDFIADKLNDSKSRIVPDYLYTASGELDRDRLLLFLKRQGISLQDFEQRLEEMFKQQFVMSLLPSAAYEPQASSHRNNLAENSTRTFVVLSLDMKNYLKQVREGAHDPDKKAIKQFFKQQNSMFKRYWEPEKRSATVWSFDPARYGLVIAESEIVKQYNQNKEKFGKKSLQEVRPEIEKALLAEKFASRFAMDARRMVTEMADNPQALNTFAQKHAGRSEIMPSGLFDQNNAVSKKLFALKKPGKASALVDGGVGKIVVLDEITEAYEPKIESIMDRVEADYYQAQALAALQKDLKKLKAAFSGVNASPDSVKELAKTMNARLEERTIASSDASGWEKADKDGLPVAKMKHMTHTGFAVDALTPDAGFVVLLQDIAPLQEQQAVLGQNAGKKPKERFFAPALIASLQNNATITYTKNSSSQV